jgi:hypothetical protein
MLNRNLVAVIGTVFALTMGMAGHATAQTAPPPPGEDANSSQSSAPARREHGTRMSGRNRQPAAPSPQKVAADAQVQATAAGLTCQVTEAINPGVVAGQVKVYEVACASGPGYILMASTPPQSFDCLELAGTAYTARLRDPAADVGQQCVLPANQNGLAVIGGWARDAGVTCTIDEAIAIGKSAENNIVYEVGCAGADGYWLEKTATGWQLRDCLQVASVGSTCRFSTAQEQAQGFKAKLVDTAAAACDVNQVRLMGQNDNGRFYEVKCAAEGEGFIARLNREGATQEIYPCATAQRIGGGCTLTPAPAAAPAATPAPTE